MIKQGRKGQREHDPVGKWGRVGVGGGGSQKKELLFTHAANRSAGVTLTETAALATYFRGSKGPRGSSPERRAGLALRGGDRDDGRHGLTRCRALSRVISISSSGFFFFFYFSRPAHFLGAMLVMPLCLHRRGLQGVGE